MTEPSLVDGKYWKSIDIFLFTNGEKCSPPRKYHLNSDSFMMWNGTLSSIGHSHFGSDETIDIYTIDGHKINDPSQLTHQGAYVAVQPSDTFVEAGYDKYLIKATRSWEKRLLNLSNSVDSSNKGNMDDVKFGSQLTNDGFNENQTNDQNKTEKITETKSTIKNKRSIIRPCVVKIKPPEERIGKSPEANIDIQKKKISFGPKVARQKKASAPIKIPFASKKMLVKTKESFHKKPLNAKHFISSNIAENDVTGSFKASHCKSEKPSTMITSFNVTESKFEDAAQSNELNSANLNQKIMLTSNLVLKDENIDMSAIYRCLENEIKSNTETCANKLNQDIANNPENNFDTISFEKLDIVDDYISNNILTISSDNEENKNQKTPLAIGPNSYQTRRQLGHFVSVLSNDKIFKLQLNLEIKDCNVTLTSEQIDSEETQSFRSIIRKEKETQVNIYELSNVYCVKNTQYEVEEDVQQRDELVKVISRDENKVIIINCSCCDCVGLRGLFHSSTEDIKVYKEENVTELTSSLKEETKICKCIRRDPEIKNEDIVKTSVITDFEKEKLITVTSGHILSPCTCDSITFDVFNKEENYLNENPVRTQYSEIADKNFQNFINTYTQTSWCNVTLEVRHNADGRYTFHLPALQKIKNYID